jgi:hypothetical protein
MYPQHQVPIITSARACTKAIQEILQHPIVALDCEGVNLSKRGKLCLIQIATPKRVYLFDVVKGGDKLFFDKGLRLVLENRKILKIVHDCRRDSEALYYQYGIYLRGVWDSQVAFAILSQLKGTKTPYPVGLNTLFRVCGVEGNQFKDSVKHAMSAMKNFWEVRPLSRMMVDYAAGDVKSLLNVYSMITADLTLHAHGYDFKKMIEEYSKQYVLMNICEDGSGTDTDSSDGEYDGATVKTTSYNLYGIKFWDEDIGLGSREVFEEYKFYEKAYIASTASQHTTSQCQEDAEFYGFDDSVEAEAAEVAASYGKPDAERNNFAHKITYADGHQFQFKQHERESYYVRRRYY